MEHLEEQHHYDAREQPSWLPEYRLGHTILLVLLTGLAGWYAFYRAAAWLLALSG